MESTQTSKIDNNKTEECISRANFESDRNDFFDEEWVSLRFDDRVFKTEVSTLTQDKNCMFYAMLNERSLKHQNLKKDKQNNFLFDRSGKYFEPLLHYLRTGHLIIDNDISWEGVYYEAEFFNFSEVLETLQPYMDDFNEEMKYRGKQDLTRKDIVKILVNSSSNTKLRFQGLNLCGLDLSKLDLSSIIFKNADLSFSNLSHCNLENCDFRSSILNKTEMKSCVLKNSHFEHAKMDQTILNNCTIISTNFYKAKMNSCSIKNCTIKKSCFRECSMKNANLSGSQIDECRFTKATLVGIKRDGCNISMGGVLS